MRFYNNNFSPNAKRARVCAAEVGVKLDVVDMDFGKGDNRKAEYLAKNPMGKVPTLEDGDYVLWESPAQLVYIAAKHPEKGLWPTDALGLAEATRWMFWNASHLEAAVFSVGFEKLVKPMMLKQPTDEAKLAAGTAEWSRFAPVLDAHLAKHDWLVGKAFTVADIALGTTVEFGVMCGLDLAPYKHLASWMGRLRERPSWKA
jgi:glutathione S-transferase